MLSKALSIAVLLLGLCSHGFSQTSSLRSDGSKRTFSIKYKLKSGVSLANRFNGTYCNYSHIGSQHDCRDNVKTEQSLDPLNLQLGVEWEYQFKVKWLHAQFGSVLQLHRLKTQTNLPDQFNCSTGNCFFRVSYYEYDLLKLGIGITSGMGVSLRKIFFDANFIFLPVDLITKKRRLEYPMTEVHTTEVFGPSLITGGDFVLGRKFKVGSYLLAPTFSLSIFREYGGLNALSYFRNSKVLSIGLTLQK